MKKPDEFPIQVTRPQIINGAVVPEDMTPCCPGKSYEISLISPSGLTLETVDLTVSPGTTEHFVAFSAPIQVQPGLHTVKVREKP